MKNMALTLTWDAAEYTERGTLVLPNSLSLLVIVTWTGNRAIMRDTFLIVDSIIDFSASSKRIKFIAFLKVIINPNPKCCRFIYSNLPHKGFEPGPPK